MSQRDHDLNGSSSSPGQPAAYVWSLTTRAGWSQTENAQRPGIPEPLRVGGCLQANLGRGFVIDEYAKPANPWTIQRAMREARQKVPGLPEEFRFHDLRHYFASLLIADGLDVKVVQARLRHASAKTTLDVYGHLWPDRDEVSRAAVSAAIAARQHHPSGSLGTSS